MESLLNRIAEQLRQDGEVYATVLQSELCPPLTRAEEVQLKASNEARQRLVDDVDKVRIVLRKMK